MSIAAAMDDLPRPAWIVLMILGFIAFWPIGLGILFYLIWSGKMGCWKHNEMKEWRPRWSRSQSSGNMAFDEYRDETLKRLEEEQREFAMFVKRLRRAKDQHEFDQFMAERENGRPA